MNRRLRALLPWSAAFAALIPSASGADQPPSLSSSRQIYVYCEDAPARARVASFADEMKAGALSVLGLSDRWKFPIIITIRRAKTASPQPASEVRLFEMETGFKVGVNVVLGDDMSGLHFQHDLVRAVLLELAYRQMPAIKSGHAYPEPPEWLVTAIIGAMRQRGEPGVNADVFKTLVAGGKVPELRDFLSEKPAGLDSTSRALYEAQSLSLLQLLIELPQGRASLATYVRDFPRADPSDPAGNLIAHFPALAGSEQSLGKWWALSLARFASTDRFHGMSADETEKQLAALLTFVVMQKDEKKTFTIDQYGEYLKIPASREVLKNRILDLAALATGGHALFRPILVEYEQILVQIGRGKTRDLPKRLAAAAHYRELILTRLGDINDYLNWMEATQMPSVSDAFKEAVKSPAKTAPATPKRDDGITLYMDSMEREFGE